MGSFPSLGLGGFSKGRPVGPDMVLSRKRFLLIYRVCHGRKKPYRSAFGICSVDYCSMCCVGGTRAQRQDPSILGGRLKGFLEEGTLKGEWAFANGGIIRIMRRDWQKKQGQAWTPWSSWESRSENYLPFISTPHWTEAGIQDEVTRYERGPDYGPVTWHLRSLEEDA